jgi:hypothetical protein
METLQKVINMETVQRIPGFENYHVSISGTVYNITGHWNPLKHMITKKGYHMVALYKNGKRYYKAVARLVAVVFIPNPENKPEVNHIDGNKDNNNDWNLEWMTTKENIHHAMEHGLRRRSKNCGAKRISVDVFEFPSMNFLSSHDSISEAAREYAVSDGNIWGILRGYRKQTNGLTFKKTN